MIALRTHTSWGVNGTIHTRQLILIGAGTMLFLAGFACLCSELWRTFTGLQTSFRWEWIGVALCVMIAGLVLVQTLNVFKMVEEFKLVWNSRYPGGRRAMDPPLETAPPYVPREKWPKLPPRVRHDILEHAKEQIEEELHDVKEEIKHEPIEDDHGTA